jgi:hypothetical protein
MGGSGGGGTYRFNPTDLEKLREEAQERLARSRRDAAVNAFLQHELVDINDRNADLVGERLGDVEEALAGTLREFDRVLFGGSVAKHTYVDGLSDIDSLVVLDPEVAGDHTPGEVRSQVEESLRQHLNMGEVKEIKAGRLAVTVTYKDGMEIQLLPAVERGDTIAISSPDGTSWAQINPKEFADKLTRLNNKQGASVVPTIKLAKAIIANTLAEDTRPSGYHVEALAVAAFGDYEGARTPKAMVERFFEAASTSVLNPIGDVTGQSRYVDEALGKSGSAPRRALALALGNLARRVKQSDSVPEWRKLLGD